MDGGAAHRAGRRLGRVACRPAPVRIGEAGNLTVSFLVVSYAGTLVVTAVADPDHVPDLPGLTAALRTELDLFTGVGTP